jgi:hypothetical protein
MEIKKFIKEHKKELIIGGVTVAIAGVGIYLGVSKGKPVADDIVKSLNPDKTFVPDLAKFGVDAVYDYGGAIEFMTGFAGTNGEGYPTKVGDIAEIVEILKEKCGVTDLSDVYIMMNIRKTTE